jgi:hypothetical protein
MFSENTKIKASIALSILIECAKKKDTKNDRIYYSELAVKLNKNERISKSSARSVSKPLEYIRDEICEKKRLPKINLLAVNKKTGVPGKNAFGRTIEDKKEREKLFDIEKEKIYACTEWDKILAEFITD